MAYKKRAGAAANGTFALQDASADKKSFQTFQTFQSTVTSFLVVG
jgi:hypothetical protein